MVIVVRVVLKNTQKQHRPLLVSLKYDNRGSCGYSKYIY